MRGKMLIGRVRIQIFLTITTQVIIIDIISNTNKYLASNIIVSKLSKEDMQKRYQNESKKAHRQKVESYMKISAIETR